MAKVYRVETEDGVGPYSGIVNYMDVHGTWACLKRHPAPSSDGLTAVMDELFGFHTKRLFSQWFNAKERKRLAELGYSLSTYRVPADAIKRGGSQCSFAHNRAELISREALA